MINKKKDVLMFELIIKNLKKNQIYIKSFKFYILLNFLIFILIS